MFGDETIFWLDWSLNRTWARVGQQPHVDTFGQRQIARVFGAMSLEEKPRSHRDMAIKHTGASILLFLQQLVRHSRRKIFLIIDNGPCHNLNEEAKAWLRANKLRTELHRLAPYCGKFNAFEGA